MNWDALGAMGEIAGAIAVIATLFFLARQLQVNTRELERNIKKRLISSRSLEL